MRETCMRFIHRCGKLPCITLGRQGGRQAGIMYEHKTCCLLPLACSNPPSSMQADVSSGWLALVVSLLVPQRCTCYGFR